MAKILTTYYRPKPGGLCKRLFRSINALLAEGHSVNYLSVVPFPITHPNCRFHRFPWPASKTDSILFWLVFHTIAPLMLLSIGYRYKVTQLFSFGSTYALILQPIRFMKRIPLTIFLRADVIKNHQFKESPNWLLVLEKFIEGLAINGTHLYGVSNELTKSICARHAFSRPIFSEVFPNDIRSISDSFLNTKTVLPLKLGCVGILEKRKNQKLLLEVMQQIPADKAQLYIYGVGPDELALKRWVGQNKLLDRVFFKGWVNTDKIFENIDILLMPSLHEGCPNAVLEAMGKGIPVLASKIPEHRETLPQSHLLPLHILAWITRLEKIFKTPHTELFDMRNNQLPWIRKFSFEWDSEICKRILR